MTNREYKQIVRLLNGKKHLYCDFFETLVYRKETNTHFFDRVADYLYLNGSLQIDAKSISDACSKYFNSKLSFEDSLRKIIIHFELEDKLNFNDFKEYAKQVLFECELEDCLPTKNSYKLLKYARKNKIDIHIISNFYYGKELIRAIVQKLFPDIEIDSIVTSCEQGELKEEGLIKDSVNDIGSSLMIGDNFYSDIDSSKKINLDCFHINSKRITRSYKLNDLYQDRKTKKIIIKQVKKLKNFDASFSLPIYEFLRRIYSHANYNEDIFFLAREGQFLKKMFDMLFANSQKKLKTHYLYVSRNALFLPSCPIKDSYTAEDFKPFFREQQIKIDTADFFLTRLGFSQEEKEEVYSSSECEQKLTGGTPEKILKCDSFTAIISRKIKEQRELFLNQFSSSGKEIILIDVGWRGTIQDRIRNIINKDIKIKGFYYGYTNYVDEDYDNLKQGLMFDGISANNIFFRFHYFFLEQILRADHGEVRYFTKDKPCFFIDKSVQIYQNYSKPILDEREKEIISLDQINKSLLISSKVIENISSYLLKKYNVNRLAKGIRLYHSQNDNTVYKKSKYWKAAVKSRITSLIYLRSKHI